MKKEPFLKKSKPQNAENRTFWGRCNWKGWTKKMPLGFMTPRHPKTVKCSSQFWMWLKVAFCGFDLIGGDYPKVTVLSMPPLKIITISSFDITLMHSMIWRIAWLSNAIGVSFSLSIAARMSSIRWDDFSASVCLLFFSAISALIRLILMFNQNKTKSSHGKWC